MAKLGLGRAKRLVLDIGSSAIRVCELTQTKAGYQLTKYRQREAPIEPTMDDETKKQMLRDTLKTLLKDAKIRTRKTVFGVPGRSVFTRPRTLPPVPEYKVAQIVRYEIQQQIPFSLDQIALDYQILSRTEASGYDVLMAAIKADVVDKHIDIFRDTKCGITQVDVCPLAAYNWVKHLGEFGTQGECVALLDLGASTTDIVIERQNQFRFTRPLNLAGNDITAAIRDKFGLSFSDAEKFKRQRGFAPTGDPQRDGKIGEVIGQVLGKLVTEINRSFAYFRSQPGGGVIDRVIVTGGGACLRNVVPYLQQRLGVDVRIVRPLAGLVLGPEAQEANEHPEQSCVALGMALRCCETVPIEINLIPPRVLEAARRKEQVFYWILSIVTVALIAASIIPARAQKDRAIQEQIKMCEQYLILYDPVLAKTPLAQSVYEGQLETVEKDIASRLADLNRLDKASRKSFSALNLIQTINDLRPEGGTIWISSLETTIIVPPNANQPGEGIRSSEGVTPNPRQRGEGEGIKSSGFPGVKPQQVSSKEGKEGKDSTTTAPPSPNGIKILGYAKDSDALLEYIKRLKDSGKFDQGVYFKENNVERVPISELDNARIAAAGGNVGVSGSGSGVGGRGAVPATPGGPMETVVFFRVDLQFAPYTGEAVGPAPNAARERRPASERSQRSEQKEKKEPKEQ